MGLINKIALRNLVRQKRRNIILGLAIAFGMSILVVTEAFTGGISDMILNEIIVNMFGHVSVSYTEKVDSTSTILRDKYELFDTITNTLENTVAVPQGLSPEEMKDFHKTNIAVTVAEIREDVIVFGRIVGNGNGDMGVIGGMPDEMADYFYSFPNLQGDVADFTNGEYHHPVIIAETMAEKLELQLYDSMKAKFYTVTGQQQSASFTVVAILPSQGMFQDMMCYTPIAELKELCGYEEYEAQNINIIIEDLKHPFLTLALADKLHGALQPDVAAVYGDFELGSKTAAGTLLSFYTNNSESEEAEETFDSLGLISEALSLDKSLLLSMSESLENDDALPQILLGRELADELGAKVGSEVSLSYPTRFEGVFETDGFEVVGIFDGTEAFPGNTALIPEIDFYEFYFENLPPYLEETPEIFLPDEDSSFIDAMVREYRLLNRTTTMKEQTEKWKLFNRTKWRGRAVDVISMQEVAETFLQMQAALNGVSGILVLILFVVILIGVVNSLRMTVRERTREIGSIRAIGMQQKDVRNTFLLESFYLALIACGVGIVFGLILMGVLSLLSFDAEGMLAMLLDNGHLRFKPGIGMILWRMILIIGITVGTSWLPAKKASKLIVADALRHVE